MLPKLKMPTSDKFYKPELDPDSPKYFKRRVAADGSLNRPSNGDGDSPSSKYPVLFKQRLRKQQKQPAKPVYQPMPCQASQGFGNHGITQSQAEKLKSLKEVHLCMAQVNVSPMSTFLSLPLATLKAALMAPL